MTTIVFSSILSASYREELERLLFFNQNQDKAETDLPLLIGRYGMAHVEESHDRLRIALESTPRPQTLYALEQTDGLERLVGVTVYLRERDTLSLVIAAVCEDYAGKRPADEKPLVRQMVDVLCDVARQVKGIESVTLFPGTPRERQLPVS